MTTSPLIIRTRGTAWHAFCLALSAALVAGSTHSAGAAALRSAGKAAKPKYCTQTSNDWYKGCTNSSEDDYWVAHAKCINLSNDAARSTCFDDARLLRREGAEDCKDVLDWRLSNCDKLGEGRYDPVIDPADFEADYHSISNPNPYFPLTIGNTWEYRSGNEVNTVEMLDYTKLISGVTCIVAEDLVYASGNLSEGTNDWFCQAMDGTVWYFGEETAVYETNPGDNPPLPERVSIEGSFKQGRDGNKGGIIFLASPAVGDTYIEEAAIDEAEDATDILSTSYAYGSDPDLDELVPIALANLMCAAHDCIVTRNYSQLKPDVFERKYYARGIGVFLETEPDAGEVLQLTNCNFDSRCSSLPQP